MSTSTDREFRIAHLSEATTRMLQALTDVPPAILRDPSLLPDWTVAHVATHLARNADAQRNLLHWASTGVETPMYPSADAREAGIAEGVRREPREILEDLVASCDRLATAIADQPAAAWDARISLRRGGPVASDVVLDARLSEVELHHHDLGLDGGLALLSDDDGAMLLAAVVNTYVRNRDLGGIVVLPDGGDPITLTGMPAGEPTRVRGPAAAVAGWLTGRLDGADLSCDGPLPDLEAW
jgi:maleylpyruvate isomerase